MAKKVKPAVKILGFLIAGALLFGGYIAADKAGYLVPEENNGSSASYSGDNEDCVKVGVVTWGGYAGGQYFNRGFKPNDNSQFQKEYGICVEFKLLDDFNASRDAFKADAVNLLWTTVDAFTTEASGLAQYKPKVIFQSDWSRGGDAIVAKRSIQSVQDLKGKKIAVAIGTPSSTMLIKVLDAGGLSMDDIQMVQVASAIDAASAFKARQVDAAVVWSPDDEDCINAVKNSHVLTNTKKATHIIADGFIVKETYLKNNKEKLKGLVEGWLKGSSEINSNDMAAREAAKILADGLQQPEDFTYNAIKNVRLTTYGDNKNFFGMNSAYKGVTAEELWNDMSIRYQQLGWTNGRVPNWSLVFDGSILNEVNLPTSDVETQVEFTKATKKEVKKAAFSKKPVQITFASGSYQVSLEAQDIIEEQLVPTLKTFPNSRIRLEGNTDKTGSRSANVRLSKKRAQAIASYLTTNYGIDSDRFIIIGNGPDVPVCYESSSKCYQKNRRTEMHVL
jgi:NitT/TauT family transport system substrate-binding protein